MTYLRVFLNDHKICLFGTRVDNGEIHQSKVKIVQHLFPRDNDVKDRANFHIQAY